MVRRRAETVRRLAAIHTALLTGSFSDEDDDEDVSSQEDVDAGSQQAFRRPRQAFLRERPRFRDRQGHARWYGEWGTGFWHQYIDRENVESHPLLLDEFEERFRIPHELFCDFEDEMTTAGVFRKRTRSASVPPRLLLMASFKRLASGAHWPTIAECAFVSRPVLREFFTRKFVPYFSSDAYYSRHVHYPKTLDSIRATERAYRAQGFPGCVGSVDVVHMPWDAAPAVTNRMFYNGRKGAATYASVVTVDNDCIVLHATRVGPGASNDKTLILDDEYHNALQTNTLYSDYEYDLLDVSGNTFTAKGVYTICDGGFNTHCTKMATISAPTEFEYAWNERLESVRKDVERCFGQLKKRFQILRIPSLTRDFEQIKNTWRTCLVLHNILTRRRLLRDYNSRLEAVNVGDFEEQDAAVVQVWHERDVEDAEYYAHRLAERRDRNAGHPAEVVDAVVHTDDTALDRRIARARMIQRTTSHLDATRVEELEAYRTRQNSLIIHFNSLTKLGGVDHLHATRRRVVRSDNGEIVHLQRAAM